MENVDLRDLLVGRGEGTHTANLLEYTLQKHAEYTRIRKDNDGEAAKLDCINDAAADDVSVRPMAVWIGIDNRSDPWEIGATRLYYPKPGPFLARYPVKPPNIDGATHDVENSLYVHVVVIY